MLNRVQENLEADLCNMYNVPLIIDSNRRVLLSVKEAKVYQRELGNKHTLNSSGSQNQPVPETNVLDRDTSPDDRPQLQPQVGPRRNPVPHPDFSREPRRGPPPHTQRPGPAHSYAAMAPPPLPRQTPRPRPYHTDPDPHFTNEDTFYYNDDTSTPFDDYQQGFYDDYRYRARAF